MQERAAENYMLQQSRIQVTEDWKDACIQQELEQMPLWMKLEAAAQALKELDRCV